MSTLTQLQEDFAAALENFDRYDVRQMKAINEYIDARISVAINKPVPMYVQNVCPCVFRDGKFQTLCAMHQHLVDDSFKLGARSTT